VGDSYPHDSEYAIMGDMGSIVRPYTFAGGLVALARQDAGLTQRELARLAGVTQSTIGRIEAGTESPRLDTLERILAGAGVEMRVELVALDDHDRVLAANYESLDDEHKLLHDTQHLANRRLFHEAGRQAGLHDAPTL
jgi:transcriptional regulator with XRE-family HTH domain